MPDAKDDLLRPRPLEILALLPIGFLCGVLMGALTNAVNGLVSPAYFSLVFWQWNAQNDRQLWIFTVEHGILGSLFFSVFLSLILMIGIALISRFRCPSQVGLRVLLRVIVFSLLFWFVGGCNGVLVAQFLPQHFQKVIGLPPQTLETLKFAWVGGSIYGIYFGAILSTIGALSSFARKWRQLEKDALSRRETA